MLNQIDRISKSSFDNPPRISILDSAAVSTIPAVVFAPPFVISVFLSGAFGAVAGELMTRPIRRAVSHIAHYTGQEHAQSIVKWAPLGGAIGGAGLAQQAMKLML